MKARARITVVPREAGGRVGPFGSGYRSSVRMEGLDGQTIALVHMLHADLAHPGETHDVELTFGNPEYVGSYVRAGARFALMEGLRVVAEGTISDVLEDGSGPRE